MNLAGFAFAQMDRRVTIEQPTEVRNATTSEVTTTWSTFKKVWAARMSASDERFEASQQVALTWNGYKIYHLEGLNETMRVNDAGEYHYIKGIERVDRKQYMVLKTIARDNG